MTSNNIKIISSTVVESHILPHITLSSLLRSQAIALHSLLPTSSATAESQCPPRLSLHTPNYTQLFMPARSSHSPNSVIKCVSVPKPTSSAPSGIPGVNLLFDDQTGKISHVVNSTCLTALRTAAGSLLSSVLALGKVKAEVRNMVVFGDGAQALFHVWLHLRYFTAIESVTVVTGLHRTLSAEELRRKEEKFYTQLADLMSTEPHPNLNLTFISAKTDGSQIKSALERASIICTCTPSTAPLFDYSSIQAGVKRHICAVGSYKPTMCELPAEVVRQASARGALLVDSKDACSQEAGCLLQAGVETEDGTVELGVLIPDPRAGEEGTYLERLERQVWEGKEGEAGVSVFKSVGVGLQDVEVTKLVVALSEGLGLGSTVAF